MFNKIETLGGFVFHVGIRKSAAPDAHDPNQLYKSVFIEALKRIDEFCETDRDPPDSFIVILDEHDQRSALITAAGQSMYGNEPRRHLIEPPFHVESHRYQTLQAADWIAGLVGRLGAIWTDPTAYPENEVFRRYFEHRINRVSRRRSESGGRSSSGITKALVRSRTEKVPPPYPSRENAANALAARARVPLPRALLGMAVHQLYHSRNVAAIVL